MQHLDLNWRKVLNARIAILKATTPRWPDAHVQEIETEFRLLEDHLLARAARLGASPDDETVSVALARISDGLDVRSITGIHNPLFEQISQDVSGQLAGIACEQCVAAPACLANPGITDQHGICCVAFFGACMELARAESIAWYEKFLPICLSTLPKIEFSTVLYANPPDSISVARHISGRTFFADASEARSEIQLLLQVAGFDLESYFAAPYILFHEMICHAFQGMRRAQSNRERRTRETDPFAEGWMDWVTFRIFSEVLAGRGWSDVEPNLDREAQDVVHRYRDARMGWLGRSGNERTRASFQMGERAAQHYHAFLNSQAERLGVYADDVFFRISFAWSTEGDSLERREFVHSIRQALQFGQSPISQITRTLEQYLESGNLEDLVNY